MTFLEWLLEQQHRQSDIVGDLAREVAADPNVPASYRAMRRYIENIPHHHWNILNCVGEAWRQFRARRKEPLTLRRWVLGQQYRAGDAGDEVGDDVVGELARAVAGDRNVPAGYRGMRRYFTNNQDHHPDILCWVEEAWREFKTRPRRTQGRSRSPIRHPTSAESRSSVL